MEPEDQHQPTEEGWHWYRYNLSNWEPVYVYYLDIENSSLTRPAGWYATLGGSCSEEVLYMTINGVWGPKIEEPPFLEQHLDSANERR